MIVKSYRTFALILTLLGGGHLALHRLEAGLGPGVCQQQPHQAEVVVEDGEVEAGQPATLPSTQE